MASSIRVFNQTRGCYMKRSQARKAVDNCACAWIEFGVTLRNLTLDEAIEARKRQAPNTVDGKKKKKDPPPLPWAEIPGIIYRPAESNQASYRQEIVLMREANRFAAALLGA